MGGILQTLGSRPSQPHITILMATFNGAHALSRQLDSIAAQTHANWSLLVSDDGSLDTTRQILKTHAATWNEDGKQLLSVSGPRQGSAQNFLHLIRQAKQTGADWIAFADQDDVWLPEKLARAADSLASATGPALYCSRTWITDSDLQSKRLSAARPRPASFQNALVQNIASGNTIVLNTQAADIIMTAAHKVTDVVVHDWWIYQMITGAGGVVIHDDRPSLYYCQHPDNQIGANDHIRAKLKRLWQVIDGTLRNWTDRNITTLNVCADALTPENRELLKQFETSRRLPIQRRIQTLRIFGLYRQTRLASAVLVAAVLFNRL